MKTRMFHRILSAALALIMLALMLPLPVLPARAEGTTYTLDMGLLEDVAQGSKADGDTLACGTDDYFNIFFSAKTRLEANKKNFDDGFAAAKRLNYGGNTKIEETILNAIQIKTAGPATVKVWWVSGGDGRQIGIYDADGKVVAETTDTSVKNSLYVSTLKLETAGTYYIGNVGGNNNHYKIEVTEVPAVVETTYSLDMGLLEDVAQGSKADGDTLACGTDNFFNIFFSAKTRLEANKKNFDDGFAAAKRLNYGGNTKIEETILNAIQIKTAGPATVKIWWVSGGDGRQIGIYDADGKVVAETTDTSVKNSLYVSTLKLETAGTYYIGNVGGNNNHYRVDVTVTSGGGAVARGEWADVAAPVIANAADNGEGSIEVTVNAVIGNNGGDEMEVCMYNKAGELLESRRVINEKSEHVILFAPEDSGEYTFTAELKREGEESKKTETGVSASFVLPLVDPVLISATSKGNGTVELDWTDVKEAVSYEIYNGTELVGTSEKSIYMVEGLTVGEYYIFRVRAVRGEDRTDSNELKVKATAEAKQTWGFTAYGPSTNTESNGYVGDLNEDGKVTVYSEGGKGKLVEGGVDGVAFYYTAIPTSLNFTLRAKVTVDSWKLSNGQEGFGLMVTDRLGVSGDSSNFWNNQYMAAAGKVEYYYDGENYEAFGKTDLTDTTGYTKYTMKLGLGAMAETGATLENLPLLEAGNSDTITKEYLYTCHPLETGAGKYGELQGTYNTIGNFTETPTGNLDRVQLTEFILEIQKNNTGYFITYHDAEGNILAQKKYYDPEALNHLDADFVYAGFFAARNARATFSDVVLTTIEPEKDAPAEEKPVTKIEPTVTVISPTITTKGEYPLTIQTNVNGYLKITVDGTVVEENVYVSGVFGQVRYTKTVTLPDYGDVRIQVQFTPDPDQDLGEDTVLASTAKVFADTYVTYNKGNYHRRTIYVSPVGLPNGNGTKEYPYDIVTAINNVVAGQTIVLMEGTYKFTSKLTIQRGMDGTEDAPIRLIADPEATSRPVFDFQGMSAGIVHGGNWWYFYGFDVTRSQDGQKGFQVSGNHNVLDQINTYYNGNTGIQISRFSGNDTTIDQWPSYNLILNCTSYCNYDAGFEDADGFAAKLTCGVGNVFDGCVAYNNADDGWDMYAKVATGPIGAVTIRNCVAYGNGFVPGVEGKTGNGNGFKMGGEGITGKHVLENCYAFHNLSKGIDSNSCPDIIVKNCVSYNNGSHNVALYTKNNSNTDFDITGVISFKDSTLPNGEMIGEKLEGIGTQDSAKYINDTNYYWYGESSYNTAGVNIAADMFVSLEFKGIIRNADGTINMQGFLERNEKMPANAGTNPGGTASTFDPTLPEDLEHNYSDQWANLDAEIHWHECECGAKTDITEHTFEWIIDEEATPTKNGSKHKECTVCGHKRPAVAVYYEEPTPPATTPSEPSQSATEPSSEPSVPGTTAPSGNGNEQTGDPTMTVVIIVVVVVAAVVIAVIVVKKKK